MREELPKIYEAKEVEERLYTIWESAGYFAPKGSGSPFVIVIPPPNVTGSLHMGHALDNSVQDLLIRYNRMKGMDTLWVPGTDHAGIATQNVVERELKKEGKSKDDLGREKFLENVWKWKKLYGGRITSQLRRLGASCDWSRERFTMDEGLSKAVRKEFVSLYKEGLIYKGKRIINWCPRCKTALSDIESEHEQGKGSLWHIKYPVDGASDHVVVATTRPETMLGDTAVAVNPKDPRYKRFIGKMLVLPLVGRKIPVIKDDFVDPEFGTGAVKVTPAHDPNDFVMGERHNLPQINMLHPDGRVSLEGFEPSEKKRLSSLDGKDRFKAREEIVEMLKAEGLLEKIEDYDTSIGHCYRCKTVVEPYLSDQWFVKIAPLALPAIKAVEEGKIKFMPDRWTKVYIDWMVNLKDWCISRQIWWGHRVPVWHCECGEMIVAEEDPRSCPKCGGTKLSQETDVLDTWFSSCLWPFSTLGWPEKTEDLKKYYPTSVLVTAYDIITFWVSRMIMMGLKFMGEAPFHTVFIHGLVRDVSGKKMSKSLGNVIDPINIIDRVGADALRFALISLMTGQGQDIKINEEKITESRNFSNKIWNASRFVLMNCDDLFKYNEISTRDIPGMEFSDRWILSRYHRTIEEVNLRLSTRDDYDFGTAARKLYDFFWGDLCNWYIEMTKDRMNSSDQEVKHGVLSVLLHVLEGTLSLLHPFMPFITEELWQKIKEAAPELCKGKTIMLRNYPASEEKFMNDDIEGEMRFTIPVIGAIRNIRAQYNIPPSQEIEVQIVAPDKRLRELAKKVEPHIRKLAKAPKLDIFEKLPGRIERAASAAIGSTEIYVPLSGLVDMEKEKARISLSLNKINVEMEKINAKLSNKQFMEHAKAELIEEERTLLAGLIEEKKIIERNISSLG